MSQEKVYLVTGGAGFIGSNIAEALVKRGDRVRVFDNFVTGRRENLEAAGRVELIEGDLRDPVAVRRAVAGVDGVFHEAALRSVPRSVDDPTSSNEVNITGTLNLLMACREAKVGRVVYASSSSVYGDDPALPKVETLPTNPISPYAVSKLGAENYCRTFARLYGLETVSLRYFNVFGPRQNPESIYSAVIPRFLEQALKREPLEVHGDGLQSRDFTYIDNVVQGNLRAMQAPAAGVSGEVFNIACNTRHSLIDIADEIGRFLGRTLERKHVAARAGDVKHTLADISKAERLLGYKPTVDFAEGMHRTCTYFVQRFGTGAAA
ncbi:MAG TPA: SDR family oxidoreductase [Candidatus Eisenbacteria bacterium]|nr:SDR family oxidoreductase [Candidatus Eisenbacteria bacterium]